MKSLDRMLFNLFIKSFLGGMLFFILFLEMMDLLPNIVAYLERGVTVSNMLHISLLYLPKTVSFSLPIALLFAISFTMGNLYAQNELIAVFGNGVSLYRFVAPLILFGIFLSIFSFYFEEYLVINSYKEKLSYQNQLLYQQGDESQLSQAHVTLIGENPRVIYHSDYYNDNTKTLSLPLVILKDVESDSIMMIIEAQQATWREKTWVFSRAHIYIAEEDFWQHEYEFEYTNELFIDDPSLFQKRDKDIDTLPHTEAKEYIVSLRKSGFPYRTELTNYYKRWSFALTPLIVTLISSAMGGWFKSSILILTLGSSLSIAVVYYVLQMITTLLAGNGAIPPFAGAWIPFVAFFFLSIFLMRFAKT